MPEPRDIILIGNARKALAEAKSLDDVKKVRDKAEAVRMYAKAQGDCFEIQNQAAEVKLRAERRAGELLTEMEKNKGGRPTKTGNTVLPVSPAPKLEEIGIDKMQASRWQQVAAVPEPVFEEHVAEHIEEHKPLTTAGVLALAKPNGKPQRRFVADEEYPPLPDGPSPQEQARNNPEYRASRLLGIIRGAIIAFRDEGVASDLIESGTERQRTYVVRQTRELSDDLIELAGELEKEHARAK